MSTDLDTRLRGAARSLHHAADDLDPTTPPRDPRPRRVAALAVLVVVALVAAVAISRPGRDDGSIATNPDGIPRLIPDAVPAGVPPLMGLDLPGDLDALTGGALSSPVTLYGDPDAAEPFVDDDLAVWTTVMTNTSAGGGGQLALLDPVELRDGKQGDLVNTAGQFTLTWFETDTLLVSLATRTLTDDELVAVAEALVVEGDAATLPSVPDGVAATLDPVVSAPVTTLGVATVLPSSAPGYFLAYETEDYSRSAAITMLEGGAAELTLLRWLLQADEQTSIGGRDGWTGVRTVETGSSIEGDDETPVTTEMSSFVWEESPGVVAFVEGRGLTEQELVDVVESLRPATEDEWSDLRALQNVMDESEGDVSEDADQAEDDEVEALAGLDGDLSDGAYWEVYLLADGNACATVWSADGVGTGEACSSPADAVVLYDHDDEPVAVYGVRPPDAADVRFVGAQPTGDVHEATSPDGEVLWAAVFEDGAMPTGVELLAEDGTVLGTMPLGGS